MNSKGSCIDRLVSLHYLPMLVYKDEVGDADGCEMLGKRIQPEVIGQDRVPDRAEVGREMVNTRLALSEGVQKEETVYTRHKRCFGAAGDSHVAGDALIVASIGKAISKRLFCELNVFGFEKEKRSEKEDKGYRR